MKLLIIILLIVFIIYIYCYFRYPSYISILQTNLENFDFNMLLKRQPLVIEDNIKDIQPLLKAWFSPNIVKQSQFDFDSIWNKNYFKYMLVYAQNNTNVLLYPAGKKITNDNPDDSEPLIEIKLKKFQSLIIPYRWHYSIKDDCVLYGIHDYITYIVQII